MDREEYKIYEAIHRLLSVTGKHVFFNFEQYFNEKYKHITNAKFENN